jgi:hypothetical protein
MEWKEIITATVVGVGGFLSRTQTRHKYIQITMCRIQNTWVCDFDTFILENIAISCVEVAISCVLMFNT